MTAEEYRALLDVDFDDMNIKDLPDLKDIRIDRNLPLEERKRQYVRKVGNPYMVRIGDTLVKVSFANNGISLEEAFKNMLLTA